MAAGRSMRSTAVGVRREPERPAAPPTRGRPITPPPPVDGPSRRRWLVPVIIAAAVIVAATVAGVIIASAPGVAEVPGRAAPADGGNDAAHPDGG